MNGYNFTERVRRVLTMARDEAPRLHHEYIGTEHILLGLLREEEGIAAAVFKNLKIDVVDVGGKIEETVNIGRSTPDNRDLPYTSRAKKVLELAVLSARDLKHNYVGTEHLLLGLLREENGIAAQILNYYGLTLEAVRDEVQRLLGGGPGDAAGTGVAAVVSVKVRIRFADGSELRKDCNSVAEAVSFLSHQ